MSRAVWSLLWLITVSTAAQAQEVPVETGIRFSLKRPSGLSPVLVSRPTYPQFRPRMEAATPVQADDRDQDIQIRWQTAARRFLGTSAATSFAPHRLSRSRMVRYGVQDRWLVGEHLIATLGWHGIKVSNRNANVTAGPGLEKIRANDWFLPRATLVLQARQDLALSLDYADTLRAYGETGMSGPMGLRHDDFLALRRTLKPETQSRVQMRADWSAAPTLGLSLSLQGGRIDDRLRFTGRGTVPVNSGSARIDGAILEARHQVTPQWQWSIRYSDARVRMSGGDIVREQSLSAGSVWRDGPWRAALSVARSSAPTMAVPGQRALRMEAGVDYALAAVGGRPITLSLHMTDPDNLVSGTFARDDLSGSLRAADQARAVMARARLGW